MLKKAGIRRLSNPIKELDAELAAPVSQPSQDIKIFQNFPSKKISS
jgi:hypothetical protein